MEAEVFVDTSGFFAALSPYDQHHEVAGRWLAENGGETPIVTSDYVLDETVTLLQSRRQYHLRSCKTIRHLIDLPAFPGR